eukprot:362430-Chlamydomonas_euryale.AAC.7
MSYKQSSNSPQCHHKADLKQPRQRVSQPSRQRRQLDLSTCTQKRKCSILGASPRVNCGTSKAFHVERIPLTVEGLWQGSANKLKPVHAQAL